MKTKDQVQREAIRELKMNGGSGIVEMATGTGKSKIPIDIAKEESDSEYKILLIVPTQKLRDVNWKNEFDKWDASEIWNMNVQKECYASLHKMTGHYDLVILDEVHNITEANSVFFQQCTYGRIVGLTATMPRDNIKAGILKANNLNIVYTVTVDEAVEWGLISPYKIVVVKSELNRVTKNVAAGSKAKPFMQTEKAAYDYISNSIFNLQYEKELDIITKEYYYKRRENTPSEKKKLEMLIFKRLHLIYNLSSKLAVADYIKKYFIPAHTRTLIFAGSIAHAQFICNHSFHSKTSKNDTSFDDFVNKKINKLSCVNSLNEGHNLSDVDDAIVIQLNSSDLKLVQRIGRIVRYRDGHLAMIYIVVAKDTVDEDWAKKALAEFDPSNISEIDFTDLKLQHLNEAKS